MFNIVIRVGEEWIEGVGFYSRNAAIEARNKARSEWNQDTDIQAIDNMGHIIN